MFPLSSTQLTTLSMASNQQCVIPRIVCGTTSSKTTAKCIFKQHYLSTLIDYKPSIGNTETIWRHVPVTYFMQNKITIECFKIKWGLVSFSSLFTNAHFIYFGTPSMCRVVAAELYDVNKCFQKNPFNVKGDAEGVKSFITLLRRLMKSREYSHQLEFLL